MEENKFENIYQDLRNFNDIAESIKERTFEQVSAVVEYLNDLDENVEIDLGYTPRPFQQLLHASLKRFNVLVCHRR